MRIIAGQRRGHKIDGPRASNGTRPTSDMVRESLFNILGELVVDRVVVDLFAGTGALGLEALSRGAGTGDLRRAGPRERRADPPQHRHAPLRGPHRGPARRRLSLGPVVRAGRRPPGRRLPRPAVSRVRDPCRAPEPDARGACREVAGRLGDRARGGPDARRRGSCPISTAWDIRRYGRYADRDPGDPGAGGAAGRGGRSRCPGSRRTTAMSDAEARRRFALEVVRQAAAGGVPDALGRGVRPRPDPGPDAGRLRRGDRRDARAGHGGPALSAVTVGISFGVVRVRDPRRPGVEVEIATFRSDGAYVDGRRPESVVFSSPELDAARRDFTINGMFLDPLTERGDRLRGGPRGPGTSRPPRDRRPDGAVPRGQAAPAPRRPVGGAVRADDRAGDRSAALRAMAAEVVGVSAERIAQELRRMLVHERRGPGHGPGPRPGAPRRDPARRWCR